MNRKILLSAFSLLILPLLATAQPPAQGGKADAVLRQADAPKWAIAIHGGAGTIPKSLPEAEK
ncbi:MAG TPA: hypothetical protein VGG03_23555, partial [Thermoanaerobaculia bacterium]